LVAHDVQAKDTALDDADGATALIAAAGSGELEIARDLMIYGTDPTIATSNGKTALSLADHSAYFDVRGR
jgi:ankyrin repeat protein